MSVKPPEIRALTGVRAIAAVWVVLFHLQPELRQLLPGLSPLFEHTLYRGYLGVDLFFLLSGFILAYNYGDAFVRFDAKAYGRFLGARLARIYPVHLAMLACVFAMALVAAGQGWALQGNYSAEELLQNLALTMAWRIDYPASWNVPAWSISCEWAVYLCFPLFALAGHRIRSRAARVAGCLALLGLQAAIISALPRMLPFGYGIVRVFCEFGIGVLLFGLHRSGAGGSWPWAKIAGLALVALPLASWALGQDQAQSVMTAPLFLSFLVYALACESGGALSWLSSPFMGYCGRASYSLYMVHGVWLIAPRQLPAVHAAFASASELGQALAILLFLAAIGASAVACHEWVERPSRRHLRAWIDRALTAG